VPYDVRDRAGKKTGQRAIAIGEIDGAHCAELSFVFGGATPQAEIVGRQAPALKKARRMMELDILPRRVAYQLEQRMPTVRMALHGCPPPRGVPGYRVESVPRVTGGAAENGQSDHFVQAQVEPAPARSRPKPSWPPARAFKC
jgi:hypothetical protein